MNSYMAQPFIHSSDANKNIVNKANYTSSSAETKKSKDMDIGE